LGEPYSQKQFAFNYRPTRYDFGMLKDDQSKGKPLAIDPNAVSASSAEPAFVARPADAPVYHGFAVLEDVTADGFTFGAITDFEAELCDAGDAFVIAPDGSRAGLVWEVAEESGKKIEQVLPFSRERWGVWAVWFAYPMRNRADAHKNLVAILPDLKAHWEEWKRWLPHDLR
jgi:hypothetical protein